MASHSAELEAQVRKLAQELAEYKAESKELKNQDGTIRRLEERVRGLEAQNQEKVGSLGVRPGILDAEQGAHEAFIPTLSADAASRLSSRGTRQSQMHGVSVREGNGASSFVTEFLDGSLCRTAAWRRLPQLWKLPGAWETARSMHRGSRR